MQQIAQSTVFSASSSVRANTIPKLARHEVIPMARTELDRFMALIENLTAAELRQPTDCTLWTVKDVIAHQASHVTGLTRVGAFLDQFMPFQLRAYTAKGMNQLDAANQRQVDQRAEHTLDQLIAELRAHAEQSFAGRQRFPAPLRWLSMPVPGSSLRVNTGDLIDNIYTRDMWMHRVDICRATGRALEQTADHDGRIVALIMRELDRSLQPTLRGRSVIYRLTGKAGGEWVVGGESAPEAVISMDTLEFNRLASGRITAQQALAGDLAKIEGSAQLADLAVRNTIVLY